MAGQSDNGPSVDRAAAVPRPVASCAAAAVDIADTGGLLGAAAMGGLRTEARAAVGQLGRGGEVRVRLIGDTEMAAAHMKFSNVPGTTDVLTFDLSGGSTAKGGVLDVDILACVDEARRQGAVRGHAPERELLLYILHGALHCMGYDDHDDAAYQRMHAEEDRILTAIGIGPVFGRSDSSTPLPLHSSTGRPAAERRATQDKPAAERRGTQEGHH